MLGTISGALARSLICIYPITLNGYIYSPGKKIEKIKKNRKNYKKIKNHRNNFWGPCQVLNISRKTLRSLRPEIGEFAGRAGEDRAVEDRAGEDMAGQGRAGGHIKSGQSKSRAGRGQKAGQGMMGIVQYE